MSIEIKVPALPESVTDATIAKWYKKEGDSIQRDENLVDLETDKVMLEVPAPKSSVIQSLKFSEGDVVKANQTLALLEEEFSVRSSELIESAVSGDKKEPQEKLSEPAKKVAQADDKTEVQAASISSIKAGPAVRRLVAEKGIDASQIAKNSRISKSDLKDISTFLGDRTEKRVPMSRLRQRIAERLLDAQHQAAILTTFNEINMDPVIDLRKRYKDLFEKKHGVRLGFMSFFTKAVIEALQRFPVVNASIDGENLVYHNYFDIGIAIGSPRGLVVPILRSAESMSIADIEQKIRTYAERAKMGKISIKEMTGGTFTITNGGTFGSMMSTPIVNPPQSAILGMHNIVERPWVENSELVIRPTMYVALSYDHRVVDGRDSVQFLVTVKQMIEDPSRLLLEV